MTSHVNLTPEPLSDPFANGSVFEEIRLILRRPDLPDDVLRQTLAEGRFTAGTSLGKDAFVAGEGLPEDRAAVIRTMIVPPPRHGLEMPAHDLNPPLSVRFAPLVARWQRTLQTIRPQMKRAPAAMRSR